MGLSGSRNAGDDGRKARRATPVARQKCGFAVDFFGFGRRCRAFTSLRDVSLRRSA
jgi:hypothetical protein